MGRNGIWLTLCAAATAALVLGTVACDQMAPTRKPERPMTGALERFADTKLLAANELSKADDFRSSVVPKGDADAAAPNDGMIAARVRAALSTASGVRAGEIEVTVAAGVVNLYGAVQSGAERAMAEDIAARVPGVRSVNSNLVVVNRS